MQLTCSDIVLDNPKFGPQFSQKPNYQMVLVSCPNGCLQQTQNVYGVGIHPDASGICASAIVDRSCPVTGGIVAVGKKFISFYFEI